jgi:diguanylate cyclase (GGDEF)-like protein/PAS domain S-box-containing protein
MRLSNYLKIRYFNKALIRNNGIARRIMLALIIFSTLVTAIITGIELYIDYRTDIQGIDERIESIRRVHLTTLSESIWIAESTQIQNQLNGLLNLGDIEYLSIEVDGKTLWSAGVKTSVRQIEQSISLSRMHRGQSVPIGQLHVVASIDNVVARIWSRLVVMLVSNGIKTFLVTAFVLLIFQAMVGQHLEHISSYLRKFSKDISKADSLKLNRPATGHWRPDALDHVVAATNLMREEIISFSQALQSSSQRLEDIIRTSPLVIYTRDLSQIVTGWNPAAEKMFGWRENEVIGNILPIVPKDKMKEFEELTFRMLSGDVLDRIEQVRQRRDGSLLHVSMSCAPLRDANQVVTGYLTILADMTEQKLAEKKIEFLAYHDALTGLPNRLLLQDRFEQAKAHAIRSNTHLALLFLDLDNFKVINDSMGHDAGDTLLKQIASRLSKCVRETDTISRQGGDEFLILLSDLTMADDTAPVLVKIIEQLQLPFQSEGQEIATSVSMGVTIFPQDGTSFEVLLKKADMAMYQAKEDGRNTYRFFDEAMNVEAVEHLFIRNSLRRAQGRDEFVLHYQPKIELDSGAITGAEALIRWNHPELGLVAPNRFIPVAEESGLIVPMGEWVLGEACRQVFEWNKKGNCSLSIAVNLSAVQFKRGDIEKSVRQALEVSGLEPSLLELELTESILIQNVESVLANVKRLKALGVKLSIDDFGTGYSSLSYLKRFDIDKLKIDQSFVRDLATDPEDAAIVRAIIQMARSLSLRTIAEGVETEAMLQQLRDFGCNEAQGYYFARPMPAVEFASFLLGQTAA